MNFVDWVRNDAASLLVQSLVHCLWEGIVLVAIAGVVGYDGRLRPGKSIHPLSAGAANRVEPRTG